MAIAGILVLVALSRPAPLTPGALAESTSLRGRETSIDRPAAPASDSSSGWQHGRSSRAPGTSVSPIAAPPSRPVVGDGPRLTSPGDASSASFVSYERAAADTGPVVGLGQSVPPQVRRWQSLIDEYATLNGLDPSMVAAIVMTESNGNPNATSPKGAVGLMQVLGGSYDPEANIAEGTRLFADDLRRFDGNVELALAAYNAGPNSVSQYQGIPPYLETENYVFEVLNRYYLYSQG